MKKWQFNQLLDLWLGGAPISKISHRLNLDVDRIKRRMSRLKNNHCGLAEDYIPHGRISRKGKPITKRELQLIHSFKKEKIPSDQIAKILARHEDEINHGPKWDRSNFEEMKTLGAEFDLIMAYQYCYYVKCVSIVTDKFYDEIVREEIEYGKGSKYLNKPGSDRAEDYPAHIRALACYLIFKYAKVRKE